MENNIKIGVGAPLKSDGLPKIGLIIISQLGTVDTYEKFTCILVKRHILIAALIIIV
jgi:hypothetical protein